MCGLWLLAMAAASAQVVEFPQGDQLVSMRIRAMGGAGTGIAQSPTLLLLNPAAMVVSRPLGDLAEIEPGLILQLREFPLITSLKETVLGTEPPPPPRRTAYWQIGATGRYERTGAAVHHFGNTWDTGDGDISSDLWSVGAGYAGGTWAVGVLPHLLAYTRSDGTSYGVGATLGGLWAPEGRPLRLGARLRTPIRTRRVAPRGIAASRVPAEAAIGASWSIGAVNVAGDYGPQRRLLSTENPHLILAADVVFTGGSGQAVALEPLLRERRLQPIRPTLSVRVGAEAVLLDQDLRVRAGMYNRPGREAGPSRVVGTTGFAYQFVHDSIFGLGLGVASAVEVSRVDVSVAVGIVLY